MSFPRKPFLLTCSSPRCERAVNGMRWKRGLTTCSVCHRIQHRRAHYDAQVALGTLARDAIAAALAAHQVQPRERSMWNIHPTRETVELTTPENRTC